MLRADRRELVHRRLQGGSGLVVIRDSHVVVVALGEAAGRIERGIWDSTDRSRRCVEEVERDVGIACLLRPGVLSDHRRKRGATWLA
jgi:hypothetical protein